MHILDPLNLVWADNHTIRIGTDSRTSIVCEGLSPDEQHLVSFLTADITEEEFFLRAKEKQITRERTSDILSMLTRAGVLSTSPNPVLRAPRPVVKRKIYFNRLDPLGTASAIQLGPFAHSLLSEDTGSLNIYDDARLLGTTSPKNRLSALRSFLHSGVNKKRSESQAKVVAGSIEHSNYGVFTSLQEVNPLLTAEALHHVPVYTLGYVEDVDIRIGPTITRESLASGNAHQACASCIFLHRKDSNPQWPLIAPQIFSRRHYNAYPPRIELAASLLAQEIIQVCSGYTPQLVNQQWVVPPSPGLPYIENIAPHEGCSFAAPLLPIDNT